jgi:opacity protein-like surface antigen
MKTRSIVFLALLTLTPAVLAADFGVRAGQYRDAGEEFVGAEVLFDAGVLNVNPNIEYSLADNVTAGTANLDVTIDIGRFNTVTPYLGAGVGLLYVDDDFGEDETDVLGNLIAGVAFKLDFLEPYAQLKYFRTLEDDDGDSDDFAVTIGLRF